MINTLIFDFGDVFINLDKKGSLQKAERLLGTDPLQKELMKINESYETGAISTEEFLYYYTHRFKHLSASQIVSLWNSIIVDFPVHRLEFIKSLARNNKYKLILLSNTNELHIDYVKKIFSRFNDFQACFDQFYLSHEINLRKPDASIYEYVLNENNLNSANCLFIDDTEENTDGARSLGFKVWNIDETKQDIVNLFKINSHLF